MANFNKSTLIGALRDIGLTAGDSVLAHVQLDQFMPLEGGAATEKVCADILDALLEVLTPSGRLFIPTYSHSFERQETFHLYNTPSVLGRFSEFARIQAKACRSLDPMFSVVGFGNNARDLLSVLPRTAFGNDSFYDRLHRAGGKIFTFGTPVSSEGFLSHVEEILGVPYRYKKLFSGTVVTEERPEKFALVCNVPISLPNAKTNFLKLDAALRAAQVLRTASVGSTEVSSINCDDYFRVISSQIAKDPWFAVSGPALSRTELETAENQRVGSRRANIELDSQASITEMIDRLWFLPRDIVSDGYDAALTALGKVLPMTIHRYATGTECWDWLLPEKWSCSEAYLETLTGKRIFSYAEHPLHVMSYSLPFEGIVTREELFRHLHVHPRLPDAIPFKYKYYERDWGLCCSSTMKQSLSEERYKVVIRSHFSYGTLKVGEVVLPGISEESIVLCAHLCHPAMVNDDLTGVVVGIDVMRQLLAGPKPYYTYRFLITPETIGSIAYLSHNEALIPKIKGGIFLEMLGQSNPHFLQYSFTGDTSIDHAFASAIHEFDSESWTGPFAKFMANDERQFNAPGVRIPMVGLTRWLKADHADWPYREYHSSFDTPNTISIANLEQSRDLVLQMIQVLEHNVIPLNHYKGEIFLSRHGLSIDYFEDSNACMTFFALMHYIDGTRSIAELSRLCGLPFKRMKAFLDQLQERNLISYLRVGSDESSARQ